MKRINLMKAQSIGGGEWRLDIHTALYAALNRRDFATAPFTVTMSQAHRPDLVALACYGRVEWWWVIAQYNGIINPIKEMSVGRTLQIPNYSEVDKLFKQAKVRNKVGEIVEV